MEALVEETRAAEKKEEPPVISANEPYSRDSMGSPASSTPIQQQTPGRCDLEQALSRKLFQDSRMSPDGQLSPQGRADSSKLDIARSQYLSLKKERSIRPPRDTERSKTITAMTSQKSGHHLTRIHPPLSSDIPVTRAPVPPPHPKSPQRTTNSHSGQGHPKPCAGNLRGQKDSCHPATETQRPKPPLHAPERPAGNLRPCTEAEEMRGRSKVMVNAGGKKYVSMPKEKAFQQKRRPRPPPQRGNCQTRSPAEKCPGNSKPSTAQKMERKLGKRAANRGETVMQEKPPISKPQQQVCMSMS